MSWRKPDSTAVFSTVAVALSIVLSILAPTPVVGAASAGAVTCAASESTAGVHVTWATLSSAADRVVIERAVDGSTYHWRGRAEPAERSFFDLDPDAAGSSIPYRVVLKRGDDVLATADCREGRGSVGRFECAIEVTDDGYRVTWSGGPSGAGLDYVVSRDVNPDDIFHWRGRVDAAEGDEELAFVDSGSPTAPVYRVTARFDMEPAASVDCGFDGVVATRRFGADIVCPVPGGSFVDTFGAPRDGGARQHMGVDLFAPTGTPVLAPESGRVIFFDANIGGLSFGLFGDSGTYYFGTHLDAVVGEERTVEAGEVIGLVGNSGNARTTPPHLHFEIRPGGRGTPAINPTPATRLACG